MDKKIAMKWAKALESGEYSQATGMLCARPSAKKKYGYCCLGVLCDIYNKETGEGHWERGLDNNRFFSTQGSDDADTHLPEIVQDWSGMKSNCGFVAAGSDSTSLIDLNDTGTSFKEIAKIIREEWESL